MKHVWDDAPFSNKRFYSRHICSYQRPHTFLAVKVNSFTLATQETSRQSNEGRSHRWTDARHRAVIEIHERGECKPHYFHWTLLRAATKGGYSRRGDASGT